MYPVIKTEKLKRYYNMGDTTVKALDGVDIEIHSGEMVSVMGPSGSGKSTLMHLVGCLDSPSHGSILIDGEDISAFNEAQLAAIRNRKIGFVFQQFNLLSKTTILDNVATPLMYARVNAAERHRRAENALVRVGLGDRIYHRPNELSGGQRQRAAIARALVTEPSLILADEPTGALDSKTGEQIIELFHELHKEGNSFLVVTHDPEVSAECQRTIRLRDGVIEEAG
ncbi:ABC transporter ATP-binding protein [Salinispira pacifica]|uniref:ABC transporter, ATP-binding protein n=1 Tax=Salinispira pacifica TaxID=1307761 RepID=V5WFX9_9SPIO|nr:ABC transporter ATP-binding protein [Salinispira pacifica]AHC14474.1 ABC transporter, ATP-binding protein [Salinispira pacifica]